MNIKKHPMEKEGRINFYRWLVWGILVAIYLIVFFHRLSVGVITEDLTRSFGMNATQIANLGAMYFYAYTIMQIPTGILADRLGPKKTTVIGCIIAAFGSIIFSLAKSIPMAYFGRLLVGLGVSVVFLCILKIQANWFPAEKFASMSGLTSFIGSMGGLLAQTPLVVLVGLIGWRNSFMAMGILTFILALLAFIFVKNTPTEMGFPPVNPQDPGPRGQEEGIGTQLLKVVKNPRVWCPALVFGGINGSYLLFTGTFGVSYLTSVYGLSKTAAANLISLALLSAGIACLLIGGISDRLRRRKLPMLVLAIATVVSWTVLVFLEPPVLVMSILVVVIGITSSVGVLCWSVGKEVSNPKLSGMAMSIVNVCGFVFSAVLMVVCGKIIDFNTAKGLEATMVYSRAFMVVVLAAVISLIFAGLTTETGCENIYNK